jgi:hypothetical protein
VAPPKETPHRRQAPQAGEQGAHPELPGLQHDPRLQRGGRSSCAPMWIGLRPPEWPRVQLHHHHQPVQLRYHPVQLHRDPGAPLHVPAQSLLPQHGLQPEVCGHLRIEQLPLEWPLVPVQRGLDRAQEGLHVPALTLELVFLVTYVHTPSSCSLVTSPHRSACPTSWLEASGTSLHQQKVRHR